MTDGSNSPHEDVIGPLLSSYAGPESQRVRKAIITLSKDDPKKVAHYINRARDDYRDVLWWADIQEEEDRRKRMLAGLSVNDRLTFLKLSADWTNAVSRGDRINALSILRKCDLPDPEVRRVIESHFKVPSPVEQQPQS